MRRPARLPVAAGVMATACGLVAAYGVACSKTVAAGGLEVLVATNLATPQDFDTLAIEVDQQVGSGNTWKTYLRDSVLIPGEAQLPAAISIQAGSSSDQLARIRLTALKNGNPIDLRVATVQIPTDRVAQMTLIIAESCVGKLTVADGVASPTCPTDQSCQPPTGTCGPDLVRGPLPIYTPRALDSIDASVGDFRHDGGKESSSGDAGSSDARTSPPDTGACGPTGCPVKFASGGVVSLARDQNSVYFCRSCSGCTNGIFKVLLEGGPESRLWPTSSCDAIAVDPDTDDVVWTDPDMETVDRYTPGTGVMDTLATGQASLGAIAIYKGIVYWTRPSDDKGVASTSLAKPTTPTLSAPGLTGAQAIAVDGTGVYVTVAPSTSTSAVYRLSLVDDQIVDVLAGGLQGFAGVAVGSGSVYWAQSLMVGSIWRADIQTDAGAATIVADQYDAYAVATDATHVYWTLNTEDGAVMAAHLDGSHIVTLANHQNVPGEIVVGPSEVYWVTPTGVWKVGTPTD